MNLAEEIRFWGGINLKKVAKDTGYTDAYVYLVCSGKRKSNKITSHILMQLESRKNKLYERLINGNHQHNESAKVNSLCFGESKL
jgi:hypothetical protein|tara:strand:+ start:161 stop:415 length:255 start_codon:yes stop_codon:yes gene_type:complete